MDLTKAWHILEMDPTEDEEAIKKQYKLLLPKHNPEDDPEGFKALREAYELALHPPKDEKDKDEEKEDDEIGRWLKRVDAVYVDIAKRRDSAEWEALLADPLCQGLDTAFDTRERLLVYIMDHQFLPQNIWRLLNETFRFVEEKEDLLEKFPENYIDYVVYQSENDTFGAYEYFRPMEGGEPEYDKYIEEFYAINRAISNLDASLENERVEGGLTDQREGPAVFFTNKKIFSEHEELDGERKHIREQLDEIAIRHVYHPYEEVERIRMAILEEEDSFPNGEKIADAGRRLLKEYGKDVYVMRVSGEAIAASGEWEEALAIWDKALEDNPDHGMLHFDRARYFYQKGDFETAENIVRDNITNLSASSKVKNFFLLLQQSREKNFSERVEKDPNDLEAWIEMCWSRFHSDRIRETMEMLEQKTYTPGTSEYYDYVDMKGRCLLEQEEYEEALIWLKKWEEELDKLPDDGSEKYKKRKRTKGYQRFVLAECYGHLALRRPDPSLFETAEEYVNTAIEEEVDESMLLPYRDLLLRLRLREGKYHEVIDDCDEQIRNDKASLPAYLRRQEAYWHLHDGQGVVDDYHSILGLYRDYYRPYLLALRVFMLYNQHEDAFEVLKTAEQAGVDHPALKLAEVRLLRACGEEYYEEFDKKSAELLEASEEEVETRPEDEKEDIVTKDHVRYEIASALIDRDEKEKALKLVDECLDRGTQLRGFYMLRGNLLRYMERYDEAIKVYREFIAMNENNPAAWYYLGLCYKAKGEAVTHGMECFQKVQDLDPEDEASLYELARCYQSRYQRYEALCDYEKSKECFDRLRELNPSPFVLSARADLIRLSGNLQEVIDDLNEALEKSDGEYDGDDSFRLYRTGDMHYLMRHTDEAERIFRQGIEKYGSLQTAPIYQLADTLGSRGKWKEALEVLLKYADDYKDNGNYVNKLSEVYVCCGDLENATKMVHRLRELDWLNEWQLHDALLELTMELEPQNFSKRFRELEPRIAEGMGISYLQRKLPVEFYYAKSRRETAEKLIKFYYMMGTKLLMARKLEKAFDYLQRAVQIRNHCGISQSGLLGNMAICCKLLAVRKAGVYTNICKTYAKAEIKNLIEARKPPAEIRELQKEPMDTEEYYLRSLPADNAIRYEKLALMHYIIGDKELSEDYLNRTDHCTLCLSCRYQECYDALIARGYIAEFNKDKAKARECFRRAAEIAPIDIENTMGVYVNTT
ncbi:MAG: tetratricopeptide repeat protein [Lachnospiraceae bacterium]|nr:tetratricopeptide repeat protein [Lachnospiraceae bacterium]